MDEQEFTEQLKGVLDAIRYGDDNEPGGFHSDDQSVIDRVETFEENGVLAMNKGLVVRMEDGSEFQVTVVQSKRARNG
jgi:alpha-D-ribose 1-methylphosphonate 5-triphosphate diphosphatase PhnM